MRHGAGPGTNSEGSDVVPAMTKLSAEDVIGHRRLGCYFCNDVIAPVDVAFVALAFLKLYSFPWYIIYYNHHIYAFMMF
jgi:hypothetical protein